MMLKKTYIGFLLLSLQITGLSYPVGMALGLGSPRNVTVLWSALAVAYVFLDFERMALALRSMAIQTWLYVIVFVPLLLTILQGLFGIVDIGSIFNLFSYPIGNGAIYLTAVLFASTATENEMSTLAKFAIFSFIAMFGLNIINPSYFDGLKAFYDVKQSVLSGTRLAGAFIQPNVAAASGVFIVIFGMSLDHNSISRWMRIVLWLGVIPCILLTGSRTSLFSLMLFFLTVEVLKFGASNSREFVFNWLISLFLRTILLAAGVVMLLSISFPGAQEVQFALERVTNAFEVFNKQAEADASVSIRLDLLPRYFEVGMDNFLLGIGQPAATALADKNQFGNVSQNLWVQYLVVYGFSYTIIVAMSFIVQFGIVIRKYKRWPVSTNAVSVAAMVVIAFISFSLVDIFAMRTILIVFAFLVVRSGRHFSTARLKHFQNPSQETILIPQSGKN